ncbi:MAG: hypothetical protein MK362_06870 [SAR202 cluster bacterium]|nr:hypothetical protein [SAR202 cluster bacterium]|tara:strand:+ start:649 stop:1266 length:618 start_codon:yes stop_codon:yes gene_type:complete
MSSSKQTKKDNFSEEIIGEVIRASSTDFETQCYELYQFPPLGSLVTSDDENPVFGIVSHSVTESLDPSRTPRPRGPGLKNVKSIYEESPQLNNLLTSRFTAITVGYSKDESVVLRLSPVPPRILSLTRICTDLELNEFSSNFDFISRLLNSNFPSSDDVLAAFLNIASGLRHDPDQYLIEIGKEIASLLPGQMRRVNLILRNASI